MKKLFFVAAALLAADVASANPFFAPKNQVCAAFEGTFRPEGQITDWQPDNVLMTCTKTTCTITLMNGKHNAYTITSRTIVNTGAFAVKGKAKNGSTFMAACLKYGQCTLIQFDNGSIGTRCVDTDFF